MTTTRKQIMAVLRDWAEVDLRAHGERFNGNPTIVLREADIDLSVLADRIEDALKAGKIRAPEVAR